MTFARAAFMAAAGELAASAGGPFTPASLAPLHWYDANLGGSAQVLTDQMAGADAIVGTTTGDDQFSDPLFLAYTGQPYYCQPYSDVGSSVDPTTYSAAATAFASGDRTVRFLVDPLVYATTPAAWLYQSAGGSSADDGNLFTFGSFNLATKMVFRFKDASGTFVADVFDVPNLVTIAAGAPLWIEGSLDCDDGAGHYLVTCRTSPDGITWTLRGTFTGDAPTTCVPAAGSNVSLYRNCIGKLYKCQIMAGFQGGTVEASFDAGLWTNKASNSLVDTVGSLGGTWTMSRSNVSTSGGDTVVPRRSTIVKDRSVYLSGGGSFAAAYADFITVPQASWPPMGVGNQFTIIAVAREYAPKGNREALFTTVSTGGPVSILSADDTASGSVHVNVGAGGTAVWGDPAVATLGQLHVYTLSVSARGPAGARIQVDNGTPVTNDTTAVTANLTATADGYIGAWEGGYYRFNGEFTALLTFDKLLTDPEIAQLVDYYGAGV